MDEATNTLMTAQAYAALSPEEIRGAWDAIDPSCVINETNQSRWADELRLVFAREVLKRYLIKRDAQKKRDDNARSRLYR